ncbi:tetraacyldisaccharide 4'-kinase [Xylanibacter oryzae]|uniref:tetraacyldisaccharide 4'-kinase n=1 Tax=Xylanibacter oryzae TaxID=185293 RepID=UPI0004B25F04|nr:tetraacyldisaccharide 4'-kinase [Xylanibacter oryzae]
MDEFIKIRESLLPISWLYGIGVSIRNFLFNIGILKSRSFDIPIISVGNITVGGTGKTPHVEYLIRLLKDNFNIAVLSRGYKRKSKEFILADDDTEMSIIGDEPYQMKQKFPNITVAVDKDRCHGIEQICGNNSTKNTDVILLDDAYQHRYVKAGINILLVDYHRMLSSDKLLPAGRLRESEDGKSRADMVIITKCPSDLKPMEFRVITKAMDLYPYQQLFFTTLIYKDLMPIYEGESKSIESISEDNILLLTGIASPQQILEDMKPYMKNINQMTYQDHHQFTDKDVEDLNNRYSALPSPKIIITTEKDATRIKGLEGLSEEVKRNIYTLPIEVKFMLEQKDTFNENIIGYVRKNSRNSILAKRKDENESRNSNNSGNRTRTISFRNN